MPIYNIQDPSTGKTVSIQGDTPPSESDLDDIFKTVHGQVSDGGLSAPKSNNWFQDNPSAAPDKKKSLFSALFPRTAAGGGYAVNPLLDIASLPGRAVAAIGEGGGYLNDMAQTTAPQRTGILGKADSFLENIFRDPATIPTMLMGGLAGKAASEGVGMLAKPISGALGNSMFDTSERVAPELIKKANPIMSSLGQGGVQGAASAAIHGAEGEGIGDQLKEIGASALVPGGLTAASRPMSNLGKKIVTARIKPTLALSEDVDPSDILKYGLDENGSTLPKIIQTAKEQITNARAGAVDELKKVSNNAASGKAPEWRPDLNNYVTYSPSVDVHGVFDNVRQKLLNQNIDAGQISKILDDFEGNIIDTYQTGKKVGEAANYGNTPIMTQPGQYDVMSSDKIRQQLGYKAKNVFGASEPDKVKATVAKELYFGMRKAIDGAVVDSPALQEWNKKMSDLIPFTEAAERGDARISRNNILGLSGEIGAGIGAISGIATHNPLAALAALPAYAVTKGIQTTPAGVAAMRMGKKLASPTIGAPLQTGLQLYRSNNFYDNQLNPVLGTLQVGQ